MTNRLIPAAVAVLAALSMGQAFAFDEANQFNPNAITTGAMTRAQVKAELAQAQRNGEIATTVETGQSFTQAATPSATRSRAEVKAEAVQAARSGHLPLADQAF